ncbi:MAG: hypothetical protein HW400_7 [Candidatus Levybacteria bacterium]|nr:hypothetical protein [Candidatus Levybacteria bacterium]
METTTDKSPFPLEFLERGLDKINKGWSFEKAINLLKELDAQDTTIRTDQIKRKLELLSPSPNSFQSKFVAQLDAPESSIFIADSYKETKLRNGARIIHPDEFLLIVNLNPEEPQGNPPARSVELSTIIPREKAVPFIEKVLESKIPTNWKLNPAPHHYLHKPKI